MSVLTKFIGASIFVSILSFAASAQISSNTRRNSVSENEISRGLKEALGKGVRLAINTLGQDDGFFRNPRVKIPLPNSLQKLERGLRIAGQGRAVDDFILSMNRAAEKAVPVAIDVFVDAISEMTFDDARNILFSGRDDAATQFFRRSSEETLRGKFRPIVEEFTEKVGVTQKYKAMTARAGFAAAFLGRDATDLDGYVTQKALDGLFLLIADEEKKIRRNPLGRTTDILRKVFGVLR
jgi:hypothetical protein